MQGSRKAARAFGRVFDSYVAHLEELQEPEMLGLWEKRRWSYLPKTTTALLTEPKCAGTIHFRRKGRESNFLPLGGCAVGKDRLHRRRPLTCFSRRRSRTPTAPRC